MESQNRRKSGPAETFAGVVFDMDGVIFDSEKLDHICWHIVADKYGIPDVDTPCRAATGINSVAGRNVFMNFYGPDFPYEERRGEVLELFRKKTENGELEVKKGTRELLEFLKDREIRVALASSTDRDRVVFELKNAGLYRYFDKVIAGDMVKKSKPDPDIYLTAFAAIGISPEDAYAIEDSYNGVRSAAASGAHTIMVPDLLPPTEEMQSLAEVILPDLIEVRGYLGRILDKKA